MADGEALGRSAREDPVVPTGIDTSVASPARIYDFLLGGKDNYAVDREIGGQLTANFPELAAGAQANRHFMQRAVRYLAEQGIDQFIDIGAGIPAQRPAHEVAQEIIPDARVVYVDNDPVAVVHSKAMLRSDTVTSVQADMRDVAGITANPDVLDLIDFSRPVGLLFIAVFHFISDDDDPAGLLAAYRAQMAPGSYLALAHATADGHSAQKLDQLSTRFAGRMSADVTLRDHAAVRRLFDGFQLIEPGVVPLTDWRQDDPARQIDSDGSWAYCGVARTS